MLCNWLLFRITAAAIVLRHVRIVFIINIPLGGSATFYLLVQSLVDIWVISVFGLFRNPVLSIYEDGFVGACFVYFECVSVMEPASHVWF